MGRCSYTWEEWDIEKHENVTKCCQKETWKGSDEFCIFHDPSPEKDVDLFKEMLEEQIQSEAVRHNFIGYHFPEKWDFSRKEFRIDADFRGATFQDAHFEGATFQDALFWEATFQGNAFFLGAIFQGNALFEGATFQGNALFEGATFQDAFFWGAIFQGNAHFEEATLQDAHFGRATFQDALFWEATFQGTALFWEATFQDAHLREATFQGTAHFGRATLQDAHFGRATLQDADFWEATFQDANFREATFQGNTDFREATFQGNADFGGATFQGNANFGGATFQKKVELTPKNNTKINLRYSEFLFRGQVTADLIKCLFHRSIIENVAFIDCIWPRKYVIYEEEHKNDKEINLSFAQLETIYRDLKQNMQDHGDYIRAGEFYYREMEMRRKGASKRERFWLSLYKAIAGYGERSQNTAAVSASIVFLFAFLYGASDCLHYSIENPCLQQKVIDVIYFSFVTFTTLGLGDIAPVTTLGKVLICFEAVIGAFMIAVFVVVFVRKMAR